MTQRQLDIADMQCWILRMAQVKWNMPARACSELFRQYDILGFIEECYELLRVSSYDCALRDVGEILAAIWREGPDYLMQMFEEFLQMETDQAYRDHEMQSSSRNAVNMQLFLTGTSMPIKS